ncbi:unnamed protein product [Arabidopsis lyrata]|nr:unnamed protein product [Arabidopsis lyrata]
MLALEGFNWPQRSGSESRVGEDCEEEIRKAAFVS